MLAKSICDGNGEPEAKTDLLQVREERKFAAGGAFSSGITLPATRTANAAKECRKASSMIHSPAVQEKIQ